MAVMAIDARQALSTDLSRGDVFLALARKLREVTVIFPLV